MQISVDLENGDVIKFDDQQKTYVHEAGDTIHVN